MAGKRRSSFPDVPSPLRRGVGVGGVPVPLAKSADPGPDLPTVGIMWMPPEMEPYLFGAISHVGPRLTERPFIQVRGRQRRQPRDVGLFSDAPVEPYVCSGMSTHEPHPMGPHLSGILAAVNRAVPGADFNAVLVRRYAIDSSLGFHADDEAGLGRNGEVATLSTGEPRTMVFKDRSTKKKVAELPLHHGMLAVMRPGFQERHLHGIPRRKTHIDIRGRRVPTVGMMMSFTFRRHREVRRQSTVFNKD